MKESLIAYLTTYGKNKSWVEIYNLFPVKGDISNKKKSDYVRHVFKRIKKTTLYDNSTVIATNNSGTYNLTMGSSSIIGESNIMGIPNTTTGYVNKSPIDPKLLSYGCTVPSLDEFETNNLNQKKDGLYLVLGCVHAPFTNKPFWKAMLKLAKERKDEIKGLILAGDFLDLHSLSGYDRGKTPIKGVTLSMEYEGGNTYLNSILKILNDNIYKGWIRGNHEARYSKYMKDIDNSKLGSALPSPEKALKLKERGFDIYLDWVNDEIQLGDLSIIHGEICTVTPAKKYIDAFKRSFLFFHCFSEDTEILTKDGWKLFPKLKSTDKVGTINLKNQDFEWETINSFHQYDNYKELIHFKSHGLDLMVTPEHAMIQRNTKGELIRREAQELENLTSWETIHGGINKEKGIDLSNDLIKLIAWVLTDGTYTSNNRYLSIKQCNKPKVGLKHITDILDSLSMTYSITPSKSKNYNCGTVNIHKCELSDKIINLCPNKTLQYWMLDFSKKQFDIFLTELILGDGHINTASKNSMQYYTGNKIDVDIIQALCVKNNYRTNAHYRTKDNGSWWNITINTRHNTTTSKAERVPYKGVVYCISVNNQSLVLRRNGVTSVAGNTHRTSSHYEGRFKAYNSGTMADFNSPVFNYATKYMKESWSNAFAVATLSNEKTFVETPVWNKNHFIYGGRKYD